MTIEQDMRKDPNLHHTQGARVRFQIRDGHPAIDVRDYTPWIYHVVAAPLQSRALDGLHRFVGGKHDQDHYALHGRR